MTDSIYWIWMQLMFGVGSKRAAQMEEYFSHPREIYEHIRAGTPPAAQCTAKEIAASERAMADAEGIERRMARKGCVMVTPDHPDYPTLLQTIAHRPAVLYCRGDIRCLNQSLAIAVVGSREMTNYGQRTALMLAGGLASAGAVVVSGLAVGIDAESHYAALRAGGQTVGVLGCGIDVDYPKQNRELKTAVRRHGAVITEFLPGTMPARWTFPLRNRLLSGMTHGTVVVQAGENSGALLTARWAKEQGREVFAVPGEIFHPAYRGNNRLLQQDDVRLVSSAEDILAVYAGGYPLRRPQPPGDTLPTTADSKPPAAPVRLPNGLSGTVRAVYMAFGEDALTVDEIAQKTDINVGEILSALTELELYALIQRHPGRKYGRNM